MSAQEHEKEVPHLKETLERFSQHINPGLAALVRFMGFEAVEWQAQGAVIKDTAGKEYLDLLGGFGTLSLGHSHPEVTAAVKEQLDRMPLSSKILFSKPQADLAARLADLLPGDLQYCFFCNSGAEAVEGALKLARLHTGKAEIIAAEGAFHGKTFGGLSASGREIFRKPFAPMLPGFHHVPYGDSTALKKAITDSTAAVILEPIQGEGGVIVPPDGYLREAREICDEAKVLLILDEVQTGLGRTGRLFACQEEDVAPDIICLAKALGGGVMPIGAFASTAEIWKVFEPNPLLHSSTFGGNPLACRAALAALEVIVRDDLAARAAKLGKQCLSRLEELARAFPQLIREVRGRGLLIGIEFTHSDVAGLVIAGLAQRRVIAAYTLNNPCVIRFEPPLIITEAQMEQALAALRGSLQQTTELLEGLPLPDAKSESIASE
ncbi:MAG: aminotransferase class III-fold pyridoxal phosphate-dependent enzyme [Armatimonadetes bacterium]|nr:aminotransferase class III-fold pyridoxal phosphate-dependent enzyme [Armatimonadota bacterium]NIM23872.1 aminotransferase class III-fold pyridoxal phosphate-dependent enzyme [Armatimonadota bacterium]NIM67751.1 aminotransferase class III-fold pyridoxal phosphate-dependent enzyme [Armatimonadota bacterium]NIM76260.1 aminotransferase class III-fold pyridoxal phosphate-dependent enzyme [Armatimonadota bacterium]NIN05953.1 aminotransferase class III-fold pyridoxal phosphate-dependent enzyme [Ar